VILAHNPVSHDLIRSRCKLGDDKSLMTVFLDKSLGSPSRGSTSMEARREGKLREAEMLFYALGELLAKGELEESIPVENAVLEVYYYHYTGRCCGISYH